MGAPSDSVRVKQLQAELDAATEREQFYLAQCLDAQEACGVLQEALSAARAEVEALRVVALTDDMLRYAMAALGTGSPREAERFRAFWLHAMSARKAPATPTGSGS